MRAHTINMAQALLDRGRHLWEQDRYDEASNLLARLLALRVLAPEIAERAQFYLGDIQLTQGSYSKARRHLAAAIGSGSASGETHFLMACALEWDDDADFRHAYRHYRRAVELEPGQPLYSSAYALMRIRRKPDGSKFDREALRRLRHAFAASPDDPDVVYNYAHGLMQMSREAEAEIALRRARKQWPGHPAFEELWHDYLVQRGILPKPAFRVASGPRLRLADESEPTILPFPADRIAERKDPSAPPRPNLKSALAALGEADLSKIERKLELPPRTTVARRRQEIRKALLNPQVLQSVWLGLSVGSRHLIQVLTNEGGRAEIKRLRLRVDGPAEPHGPHFGRRRAARPLDELRQAGLIYFDGETPGQSKPDRVLIPADLGKLLRGVMASAQ
jgi:tetratricopeptide (TPR) repeat protein